MFFLRAFRLLAAVLAMLAVSARAEGELPTPAPTPITSPVPPLLTSVRVFNADMYGDFPAEGFTALGAVTVRWEGEAEAAEVSEDPGFPPEKTTRSGYRSIRLYLPDAVAGPRRLYVRAIGGGLVSETIERVVIVDPIPPTPPRLPGNSRWILGTDIPVEWSSSEDSGGAGLAHYRFQVREIAENNPWHDTTLATTTTLHVVAPAEVRFGVQAVDRVGNESSIAECGIQFLIPEQPILHSINTQGTLVTSRNIVLAASVTARNPGWMDAAEDPDFSRAQSSLRFPRQIGAYWTMELEDRQGLHRTWHRIRSHVGVSNVVSKDFFLDSVPPAVTPPEPVETFAANGRIGIAVAWPVDPEPGSGIQKVELRMTGLDRPSSRYTTLTEAPISTPTLSLNYMEPGGRFQVALEATDKAGNRTVLESPVIFEINALPSAPSVTLSPGNPTSADQVVASATGGSDPDGDAITGYRYRFTRRSPSSPGVTVSGDTLSPEFTKRGERWQVSASAQDARGATGYGQVAVFTIGNSRPGQPVIRLLPRVPSAGTSIAVDVVRYSVDPDGDAVGYDFRWFRSTSAGATWAEKVELAGSSVVNGLYVEDGDLWRVEVIPFERNSAAAKAARVDGPLAWDVVRVGADNQPPRIVPGVPELTPAAAGAWMVTATWEASDPDGGAVTVDIYLCDGGSGEPELLAEGLSVSVLGFERVLAPWRRWHLLLVARDSAGAVTQVRTVTLGSGAPGGWMME